MTTEKFFGKMATAFNRMTTIDQAGVEASNIIHYTITQDAPNIAQNLKRDGRWMPPFVAFEDARKYTAEEQRINALRSSRLIDPIPIDTISDDLLTT